MSFLDFFPNADSGNGGDETGWAITSAYCGDTEPHPFTDNAYGLFTCFPSYTLAHSTWYTWSTLALGANQWANLFHDGTQWITLDVRTGMPDLSSGHDHGIEASTAGVSGSSAAIWGLQQLTSLGGAWRSVDASQPAYSINNQSLSISLVDAHNDFYVVGP